MKASSREYIRSVRGQMTLLAVVFVGAVVMALTAVALRGIMFEPYVREWRGPSQAYDELMRELAEGRVGAVEVNRAGATNSEKRSTPSRTSASAVGPAAERAR